MKTKICGITREEDIKVCQEQSVDLIGFINIKRSPRFISLDKICDLISKIKNKNKIVLVMETEDIKEVQNVLKETGINIVQFHSLNNDEIRKFKEINPKIKIIKVIGIPETIGRQKINEIKSYTELSDFLLFDSEIQGKTGGTGNQIPLKLAVKAAEIARKKDHGTKLILAGGIDSQRMKSESEILNRYFDYVDVNSGVEKKPGIKDENKINEFMQVMK